jgi:DNA polymerase elongation subunit (family B)
MYRNISYYINKQWEGVIRLDTWDEHGNPVTEEHTHQSHLYYDAPKGDVESVYGHRLQKLEFDSIIGRNKWVKENTGQKMMFDMLPPVREFLIRRFGGQQEDVDFMKFDLRVHFLDIEVAVEDEFPDPKKADYPINVMTIYDTIKKRYFTWVCTDKTDLPFEDNETTSYFVYFSETKMLRHFLGWFQANYPDVISGWNIDGFDIPYLVNRIKKKLGWGEELKLSPIGKIRVVEDVLRRNTYQPIDEHHIEGITCLDYQFLYRDKFNTKNLSSYRLDVVGEEELGYGKLEYQGSIKDFWKREFVKFVEYNIQDVKLLVDLDNKLKYIKLARLMCNMGLCEYSSIYKSQPYIYGAIVLEARKNDKMVLSKGLNELEKHAKFEGAYVFPPRVGFYGRGVSSLDLNSLYPNIMITLNISPETKVGKLLELDDEHAVIKTADTGRIVKYTRDKYDTLMKDHLTLSNNKILYWKSTKRKGFIPAFLERLYTERRSKKDEMLRVSTDIQNLKKKGETDDIERLESLKDLLDTTQHAFKIFLNSIYGQMGSPYFPMFDIENAEAVTVSGQYIIRSASKFIEQWFAENYNQKDTLIYGDTDSNYFQIEKFVDTIIGEGNEFTEENIQEMCNILDRDFVTAVNEHCWDITQNHFYSPEKRIEFKRETFCTEGMFLAKKRYILHVRNDEGVFIDKFKYTGVEVKKSEHSKKVKGFLKHIIEKSMCERWDAKRYKKEISKIWQEYKKLSFEDIGFYKGFNSNRDIEGFLRAQKGTGAHTKAVMYHNQLLDNMGIKSKYDPIMLGEKIRYTYIEKNNEYRINTIAWKDGMMPDEFQNSFHIDYSTMFDKSIISPLTGKKDKPGIIQINKWPKFDPTFEPECDFDDLFD